MFVPIWVIIIVEGKLSNQNVLRLTKISRSAAVAEEADRTSFV